MLVEGRWTTEWYKPDEKGRFVRNPTVFRNWVRADGSTPYKPEAVRYHLYVSLACPWAHRTLIMRKLKGLEDALSISVVNPLMGDDGWTFAPAEGVIPDTVNGAEFLRDVYRKAKADYTGRVTVPILWDKQTGTIVSNESRDILRMLDHEFQPVATAKTDYCPPELQGQVDATIDALYDPINNGVYRTGFAVSQEAYDEAVVQLFGALDHWDEVLGKQRFLCGDRITEADWCLFTTLYRFDPVYYVHFKCNLRRIADYANLSRFVRELYRVPGVAETCNLDHIKRHYYQSHRHLNPTGIVPCGVGLEME
jgi:putative glutathione S-transferase